MDYTKTKMSIIKDNRIISDATFATRFVSFLKSIQVNDMMGEEEFDYMRIVADSLLNHQINTVIESDEKEYLKRCHKNRFEK
jgi:hypothetical protein